MMIHKNAPVDKDFEAIKIAKEITIARLQSIEGSTVNLVVGTNIGEMFTEIHKAVKAVMDSEIQD